MVPPRSGPPKRPLARTVASTPLPRYPSPDTGSQDPKDVSRDTARDLSALAGELAALKGDAAHGLESPEYAGGSVAPALLLAPTYGPRG